MIKAGIIGATGYAGAELVRILSGHPDVTLTAITSRQYAGIPFAAVFPAMAGRVDLVCEAYSADRFGEVTDVVFTALPHQLPMAFAPDLLSLGKKVVDLSADFRFKDQATYERFYQPHTAGDLLAASVYGLSEINFKEIQQASLVGNPGCYPTSVLMPLVPLLQKGLIDPDSIIADAKSGVSGAGRSVSLTTHFCEVNEGFKAYKVAAHRHTPEMEESLSAAAGRPVHLTFTPHLVPATRGMLTTLYATPVQGAGQAEIRACLADFYAGCAFVRLLDEDQFPNISHVRGTNFCDVGLTVEGSTGRLILICAIDNLVKGAAGQAVQNMNIMFGLEETAGLWTMPYPV
jgi:N-acetyl-gamma-glutamyl-phosphate reductase